MMGLRSTHDDLVAYGDEGLYLPRAYDFLVDDPGCPLLVEVRAEVVHGRPRCTELRCRQRPDGPEVTNDGMRHAAVKRYLRISPSLFAVRTDPAGSFLEPTDGTDVDALVRAERVRRRPRTDELLAEVAEVYNGADAAPTRAVMRRWDVSKATANRWVRQAKEDGLIPPVGQ